MKSTKIIFVFDLDGTLAHTAPSLLKAGNGVLTDLGRQTIDVSRYSTFIGKGTRKQVELLLDYTGGIPEKGLDFYYKKFMESYKNDPISDSSLYPGVREFLQFLKKTQGPLRLAAFLLNGLDCVSTTASVFLLSGVVG